jgi:hypothetical protein
MVLSAVGALLLIPVFYSSRNKHYSTDTKSTVGLNSRDKNSGSSIILKDG